MYFSALINEHKRAHPPPPPPKHTHTEAHTHIHTHTEARTHTYTHAHTRTCARTQARTHACTHARTHTGQVSYEVMPSKQKSWAYGGWGESAFVCSACEWEDKRRSSNVPLMAERGRCREQLSWPACGMLLTRNSINPSFQSPDIDFHPLPQASTYPPHPTLGWTFLTSRGWEGQTA